MPNHQCRLYMLHACACTHVCDCGVCTHACVYWAHVLCASICVYILYYGHVYVSSYCVYVCVCANVCLYVWYTKILLVMSIYQVRQSTSILYDYCIASAKLWWWKSLMKFDESAMSKSLTSKTLTNWVRLSFALIKNYCKIITWFWGLINGNHDTLSRVGRYHIFTSGIRYYKLRTVFGIPRYLIKQVDEPLSSING